MKRKFILYIIFVITFANFKLGAQNSVEKEYKNETHTQINDSTINDTDKDDVQVNTLNEVTVEADYITTVDGNLLFTPNSGAVKSSVYAIDLLSKLGIPTLVYNQINRSITCNEGSPVILVDGIPASQEDLKNISADEVQNVEYSSFVPVKYTRFGNNAVINVRLKKQKNGGTLNIYECNDFTGNSVDANSGLRFYQGSHRLNLYGNFSYRHKTKVEDIITTEYTNPAFPINITEEDDSPFNYRTIDAQAQYTYAPSPSFILTAKYSYELNNSLRKRYSNIHDTLFEEYEGATRYHNNSPSHNADIYISKDINKNNSIDANVLWTNSISDVTQNQMYHGAEIDDSYPYALHSRRNAILGALDYGHTFPNNSKFDLYYSFTLSNNLNEYQHPLSSYSSNEFNHLAYVQYQGQIAKSTWLFAKTGLRADRITENDRPRTLWSNLTDIGIQCSVIDNWVFQYSGNFNTTSLSLSMYDNTIVQTSPYIYNTGNPDINPSKNLSNDIMVMYRQPSWSLTLNGSYKRVIDPIYRLPQYEPSLEAYLTKPVNGKAANSYTGSLAFYMPQLLNMFQIYANIEFQHADNTMASGWKYVHNGVGSFFQVAWYYKKWMISYNRKIPLKTLNNLTISDGSERWDLLMARFTPNKHWDLELYWYYMFSKNGWQNFTKTVSPDYTYEIERKIFDDKNWIRVAITYKLPFGSPFKGRDKQRSLQIQDNQRIYNDYSR